MSKYFPWYVIAWRLLWCIPTYASLGLLLIFTCIGFGPDTAKAIWRSVK